MAKVWDERLDFAVGTRVKDLVRIYLSPGLITALAKQFERYAGPLLLIT